MRFFWKKKPQKTPIHLVCWKREGCEIENLVIDKVIFFEIPMMLNLTVITSYEGMRTVVMPECKPAYEIILTELQNQVDLDSNEYRAYETFSLVVHNTVYFFDLLSILQTYKDDPYVCIGKCHLLQHKLNSYFGYTLKTPLSYLSQDLEWIQKQRNCSFVNQEREYRLALLQGKRNWKSQDGYTKGGSRLNSRPGNPL